MTLSEKDFRKGRKNGLGVDPVNDSFKIFEAPINRRPSSIELLALAKERPCIQTHAITL